MPNLFDRVVPEQRLHRSFRSLRDDAVHAPARELMQRAFDALTDADGNFREQFQTTGFDPRVWELYLDQYFRSAGFAMTRLARPDFLIERDRTEAAVEATSSNPTQSPEQPDLDLQSEEGLDWLMNQYLPIKYGSTLYSKLRERYWETDQVRDLPLVFAIQSFAFEGSLGFSSNPLAYYLYGVHPQWFHDAAGRLHVRYVEVDGFVADDVERPANFFRLPDCEHVSAVLFANSGTVPKFNRMGYQEGIGRGDFVMRRVGFRYDHDPNASVPLGFNYEVGERMEMWGEGVDVFHNPYALHPLPDGFFPSAADNRLEDGFMTAVLPAFHPITSTTIMLRPVSN